MRRRTHRILKWEFLVSAISGFVISHLAWFFAKDAKIPATWFIPVVSILLIVITALLLMLIDGVQDEHIYDINVVAATGSDVLVIENMVPFDSGHVVTLYYLDGDVESLFGLARIERIEATTSMRYVHAKMITTFDESPIRYNELLSQPNNLKNLRVHTLCRDKHLKKITKLL